MDLLSRLLIFINRCSIKVLSDLCVICLGDHEYLYRNLFLCRLWGEPVNLREQHDALEFFNSLVDSLDEALKALGQPPVLSKVMGGSFADQKICKDCPHR